jgi:arginase
VIAVIGAPRSAGAFAPGQEDAPAALRAAGLVEALGASDRGDTPRFRWRVDHEAPRAMNADAVVDGVRAVAAEVQGVLDAGDLPLVLGGDCTVGVGTVAGAVAADTEPRLVYLDLHPDLNTPGSVPDGAMDWMGVAHMLDLEGADERLAAAGPRRPLLAGDDLVLLGTGPEQCTAAERDALAARDCGRSASTSCAPIPSRPPVARCSAPRAAVGASSCTSTSTSSTSPTCRSRRTPGAASASASTRRWPRSASSPRTRRCSASP